MTDRRGHILRAGRIVAAVTVWVAVTCMLVSYGMTFPMLAGWIARVQFLPAAMAFSLATIVFWLIATLVFGRIYCSVACPLGVFQDICARLARLGRWRHTRLYHYSAPLTKWRNISLFLVVVSIFLGVSAVTTAIDPWSIYSRACVYVAKPVWGWIVNLFATPQVKIASASLLGIAVSVVTMTAVGVLAAMHGRTFCNSLCPVGTTLGYVSRYSVFHIDINTDKCIQCRKCEHVCKSSCIDLTSHVVDSSRCVDCFDCLPVCPNDAIHYTWSRHQLSIPMMQKVRPPLASGTQCMQGRRDFLVTGAIVALTPALARAKGLADSVAGVAEASGRDAANASPMLAVTPPGTASRREFLERCTGCGLCISHCPTRVLVPSTTQYGALRALHPVKDYDAAVCAPYCTVCTDLCPSGALSPITIEDKLSTSVGLARTTRSRCISYELHAECGHCAEVCPKKAITMTEPDTAGHGLYPVVDSALCIGCGACQYVCPAHPAKAIMVSGLA